MLAGERARLSAASPDPLLDDLRSDVGMEWVPQSMWFTYLAGGGPRPATSTTTSPSAANDKTLPSLVDTGVARLRGAARCCPAGGPGLLTWPLVVGLGAGVLALVVLLRRGAGATGRRRHEARRSRSIGLPVAVARRGGRRHGLRGRRVRRRA